MTTAPRISPYTKEPGLHLVSYITAGSAERIIHINDAAADDFPKESFIIDPQLERQPGADLWAQKFHALKVFTKAESSVEVSAIATLSEFGSSFSESIWRHFAGSFYSPDIVLGQGYAGGLPKNVLDRLQYLARIPENWDSDGSASVSPETIARAREILREAFAAGDSRLPLPSIAPAYDGMLVIEWTSKEGKELTIDVPANDESPGFLLVEPQKGGQEIETDEDIGGEWSVTAVTHRFLER